MLALRWRSEQRDGLSMIGADDLDPKLTTTTLTLLTWENRGQKLLKVDYKSQINDLTDWPGEGFVRICCKEDPGNNRKDCFQCINCSTDQKAFLVKGESWRNHIQSKAHSLRTRHVELPTESHNTTSGSVAPLMFAAIPHSQPSAAIPMDHRVSQENSSQVDHGFNVDEPYHAADGSVLQFSTGLMYPSAEEILRCGMGQLGEELEAWGSDLAGECFEGGAYRTGGQCEGRFNSISHLPRAHDSTILAHSNPNLIDEISRSVLSVKTSKDLFPYVSKTVQYFFIALVWK